MHQDSTEYEFQQPHLPVATRVEDLLDRMTTAEKAGQLVGTWAGTLSEFNDVADVKTAISDHHIGAAATFGWGGSLDTTVDDVVETVNELQAYAVEETRLGIPLLFNVDAVHGHAYVANATIFPNGLGVGATWDPDAAERAASITASEIRATGAHQNYSPTCDVGRDPRWGRVFETFGESPYLCGELAAAKARGYQGDGIEGDENVVATAKHFPAYSEPERGEDASPVDVSEYKLRNTFVPPFERLLEEDVESVMPCYNSINGEPAHASERYLIDLLRDELGFDGTVVSDWNGIRQLADEHHTAVDRREAVKQSRVAGLDLASVGHVGHVEELLALVEDGDLPESVLDDSVRRVLEQKFRLGLFEDPYVDADDATDTVGASDHQDVALECARESMTLLQNDDLLPLSGDEDVFVAGPNADDLVHQVGGWSVDEEAHVAGDSIRDALADHTTGSVTYEQGASMSTTEDVEAAAAKAAEAEVAVVAVGENWYLHEFGPEVQSGSKTGEFPTRSELRLPEAQRELVEAIHETGTPTVGVLVTGRPLIVDWMAEHLPAILMAYYPGSRGGTAVAETLFGANDPSGRLPISVPRSPGDLPQHFDHLAHPAPIGVDEHPDSYDPLFEFGHGLSYTDFEYADVSVSTDELDAADDFEVSVTLANVGDRTGTEVVQVYSSALTASRVPRVRRLQAFERVTLDPGEERTVTLSLAADDFSVYHPGDGHTLEAGEYRLLVDDETRTVTVADAEY
ncbi:glycoside hydrolase family 3 N-terminal domain-containing protein [Halorubellus salinus]|uniref:glycoside hydrolase family 3 N-terminal domain-containing protein n=1 Tax=Halorubellus salinus TaxID=755309 RepID=UPI001D089C3A|nr:glycoside hydrolase family 3 N-terminal domain-containing protein [Halorubellus salinus]